VNIVKPFWLTPRKCLKTLAGGDPNGVAESQQFQRMIVSNRALFDPFGREGTERGCLTIGAPAVVPSPFAIHPCQPHRPLRCQGRVTSAFPLKTAVFRRAIMRTAREQMRIRGNGYRTFTAHHNQRGDLR
jgi:hypothetical protein